MNHYQKFATFALRLAGTVFAIVGAMGPIAIAASKILGQPLPTYTPEEWTGFLLWFAFGVVGVLLAKRVGRLLGRGLD